MHDMVERASAAVAGLLIECGVPGETDTKKIARAVIETMRSPPPQMLIDVGTMDNYETDSETSDRDHVAWWTAMIDAALKEPERKPLKRIIRQPKKSGKISRAKVRKAVKAAAARRKNT